MESLKLTADEIRYIAVFESMTGAVTKDCIASDDKIIFVVKKGDMGLAIGRKGMNVRRVSQTLGKKIEVVEHSDDPEEFIRNLFHPYRVIRVLITEENGKKIARVEIDDRDKAQAIGKNAKNLKKVRMLAKRHHGIDNVIVI